jgi:archaetidylinositol phosphate synthase
MLWSRSIAWVYRWLRIVSSASDKRKTKVKKLSYFSRRPYGMEAQRVHQSMLSSIEKKTLIWWVNSDHLTTLGFLSLAAVGASYWYARHSKIGLALAIVFFVLNWFGDSLDGTLARVRNRQRPNYGFYLDHVLDAFGSVFVFAGLALSGYMSERIVVGLLVAYLLLSIEVFLTTHTIGRFHLSFAAFSPTELRLLLIAGNLALLYKPLVPLVPLAGKEYLLFDVGGAIGIVGLLTAVIWSAVKHGMFLYRSERLS